ncbi:MAG: hypothetical protein WCJ13_05000 [Coriobacteriia bacterium]
MPDPSTHSRKNVLFIGGDWWGCAWYRCHVPGAQLKELGYEVILDDSLKPSDIEHFDVIVFQRQSHPAALEAINNANAAGKLTVYELDDDIWSLAPTNPGYAAWADPVAARGAVDCIRAAQLVTTATPVLAERLKRYNPNVRVLRNMLPLKEWDYPSPREQQEDRVVIGWAGSTSHVEDLSILDGTVHQILDKYPHAEFVYAGGPSKEVIEPHERITRVSTTDIRGYPKILEQFHIGLIPLVDSAFNRSKSDLKFVEYGMQGIPSVVSKFEPYLHSVKHGENGFLATNGKDWIKFMSRLVESVELRREIGARAQQYARTRTIDKGIDKWVRAYGLDPLPVPAEADGK